MSKAWVAGAYGAWACALFRPQTPPSGPVRVGKSPTPGHVLTNHAQLLGGSTWAEGRQMSQLVVAQSVYYPERGLVCFSLCLLTGGNAPFSARNARPGPWCT